MEKTMQDVIKNMCTDYLKWSEDCSDFASNFSSEMHHDALELIISKDVVDSNETESLIKRLYDKAVEAYEIVQETLKCNNQINKYRELIDEATKSLPNDGEEKNVFDEAFNLCKEMNDFLDETAVFANEVNETSGELADLLKEDQEAENNEEELSDDVASLYELSLNNMDYYSDKIMEEAEEFQNNLGELEDMLRSIK